MDSYGVLSFLIILKEAIQLLPKNGKLMALVTLLSALLSVITYAAFRFSILGLAQDMASVSKSLVPDPSSFDPSDPSSFTSDPSKLQDQLDHMKQILLVLYAVEIAFIFIFLIISFATTMAIILVAAASRVGNSLSMKDLLSRIGRTWTKPFLTSIYVTMHAFGLFAIIGLFAAPVVIYPSVVTILIAVSFAIVAFFFYLYFLVIWTLAIVVSVVEDGCYGMVAMGKASELVKGQRLKGYMLTLSFFLLSLIMLVIYQVIYRVKGLSSAVIYGLFIVGFSYLLKILQVVAYTLFYFHCKKLHGEEPEIDIGVFKYELLPTTAK
ncbi:uncharacterized protein [Primulina huaijiensis]|uniref:uncharacterized protein n=1 Tax=Primulina huaijiensis TaxID=1492673 RepID=UPI003CC75804